MYSVAGCTIIDLTAGYQYFLLGNLSVEQVRSPHVFTVSLRSFCTGTGLLDVLSLCC